MWWQEEWNVQNLKRLMGHNRLIGLAHSVKAGHHHLTQRMVMRVVPRAPDIFIVPIKFYFLPNLLSLSLFLFSAAAWIVALMESPGYSVQA